jgi:hypothetical protein
MSLCDICLSVFCVSAIHSYSSIDIFKLKIIAYDVILYSLSLVYSFKSFTFAP